MIAKLEMSLRNNRKEAIRFLKFSVVGSVGTVIDFGILNLLVQLAAFGKVPANSVSFTVAVICNYIGNRLWVYPDTEKESLLGQFGQFLLVNVVGLGLNTAIFFGSDRWLLGTAGLFAEPVGALALSVGMPHFDVAYNGAKVLATAVVLFWNFFANRVWTFGDVD